MSWGRKVGAIFVVGSWIAIPIYNALHGGSVQTTVFLSALGLLVLSEFLSGRGFLASKPITEVFQAFKQGKVPPLSPVAMTLRTVGWVLMAVCLTLFATSRANAATSPPAIFGTTPAQIDASFPAFMDHAMSTNGAFHVRNLGPDELAKLAFLYERTAGTTAPLLKILASQLGSNDLQRVAAAFGQEATAAAVKTYARPTVALAFMRSPRPAVASSIAMPASLNTVVAAGGVNPDFTLYETYLNYRTMPTGAMSVGAALAETSIYAGMYLAAAWGAGYTVGTVVNNFINAYFPSVGDQIGSSVAWLVDNITKYVASPIFDGQWQSDLNGAIKGTGAGCVPDDTSGDYGIVAYMSAYESVLDKTRP
jgi:hypothetical protein